MKGFIFVVLLGVICGTVCSRSDKNFKVNLYTRDRGLWGKNNVLICHISKLSPPPEVTIELLKNNQVISHAIQSDMSFTDDWLYHMTKHVPFTPVRGERYSCRVTLRGRSKDYEWEPDE